MAIVVDTNVWVVAADAHSGASADCVIRAALRLLELYTSDEVLAVDMDHGILSEYHDNIPEGSLPRRILNQLQGQAGRISYRSVRLDADGHAVVPRCLARLDPNDRKFAAVALTFRPPARILNAADRHWQECAAACVEAGLSVEELCQ